MNTLSFEEWKEKHFPMDSMVKSIKSLMSDCKDCEESSLIETLDYHAADAYRLYLYQVKNPNWFELLRDENSKTPKVRDDWESVVAGTVGVG